MRAKVVKVQRDLDDVPSVHLEIYSNKGELLKWKKLEVIDYTAFIQGFKMFFILNPIGLRKDIYMITKTDLLKFMLETTQYYKYEIDYKIEPAALDYMKRNLLKDYIDFSYYLDSLNIPYAKIKKILEDDYDHQNR